jgi:hypothetical protein
LEKQLPIDENTAVVANLFLHHFDHDLLEKLASSLTCSGSLLFAEPARTQHALRLGYVAYPFVGRVTKHDMLVSIKAGFVTGELPQYFSEKYQWEEQLHWMGGLRSKAMLR